MSNSAHASFIPKSERQGTALKLKENALSEPTRDSIYRAYRVALKSMRGGHAAERKNRARKIIVERYKVSFQELKEIIAEGDKARNLTHEHTEQYLNFLKFNDEASRLEAENANGVCPLHDSADPPVLDSGREDVWKAALSSVSVRLDPEAHKNGELKPRLSCLICYMKLTGEL